MSQLPETLSEQINAQLPLLVEIYLPEVVQKGDKLVANALELASHTPWTEENYISWQELWPKLVALHNSLTDKKFRATIYNLLCLIEDYSYAHSGEYLLFEDELKYPSPRQ